jgi:hypothetical protein
MPPPRSRRSPVVSLSEPFDAGALSYNIIDKFETFQLRPETDGAATLATIKRYLATSDAADDR